MIYEEMCLCVVAISRKNNSVNSILLLPLQGKCVRFLFGPFFGPFRKLVVYFFYK